MPITTRCSECGTKYRLDEKHLDRQAKCKNGHVFKVIPEAQIVEDPQPVIPEETAVVGSLPNMNLMNCRKCAGRFSVPPEAVGRQVKCPHCGVNVPVPGELLGAPVAMPLPTETMVQGAASGKSPIAAAVLNFFLWGAGYVYLGRMWGLAILIPYCLLAGAECVQEMDSPDAPLVVDQAFVFHLLIAAAFGWHGYRMASQSGPSA